MLKQIEEKEKEQQTVLAQMEQLRKDLEQEQQVHWSVGVKRFQLEAVNVWT